MPRSNDICIILIAAWLYREIEHKKGQKLNQTSPTQAMERSGILSEGLLTTYQRSEGESNMITKWVTAVAASDLHLSTWLLRDI